jgi:predicted transcriptional regulator
MTDKQFVLEVVGRQSDDATLSQIVDAILREDSIRNGIDDVAAGRVVSDDDVHKRIAAWFAN